LTKGQTFCIIIDSVLICVYAVKMYESRGVINAFRFKKCIFK
jgi:hypothetical protein